MDRKREHLSELFDKIYALDTDPLDPEVNLYKEIIAYVEEYTT